MLFRHVQNSTKSSFICTGTSLECIYNLLTFGIPKEVIPVEEDGSVNLISHHIMLQAFETREELGKTTKHSTEVLQTGRSQGAGILIPSAMDIMMGRGRQPKGRPGNVRFYNLLDEHMDAYETATKVGKTGITKKIFVLMKDSGSRFLKSTPQGFVESDEAEVREKISHGFRNLRLKMQNKNNGQASPRENGEFRTSKKRTVRQ